MLGMDTGPCICFSCSLCLCCLPDPEITSFLDCLHFFVLDCQQVSQFGKEIIGIFQLMANFVFLHHIWLFFGLTCASMQWEYSWQAWGTIWSARDQIWVGLMQGTLLPSVLSLQTHQSICFLILKIVLSMKLLVTCFAVSNLFSAKHLELVII